MPGMNHDPSGPESPEAPLVGTLRFVFVLGVTFAILWVAMYFLLWERW
jgi:hypothetical protein